MLCPRCFCEVQVIRGTVYCPNCKIYLSSLEEFAKKYNQKELAAQKIASKSITSKLQYRLRKERFLYFSRIGGKILLIIIILVVVLLKYFVYWDFENRCYIKVLPSWIELSNSNIERSLSILRYASPDDYKKVCERVSTINPVFAPECGGFEGGCFFPEHPRTIVVGTDKDAVSWTVGVIVHETCHATQLYEKRGFNETECYKADDRVMRTITEF